MKLTNCVNCGAPLVDCKCKYCGTEYDDSGVRASFGADDWVGTLTVGGVEYAVYLGEMQATVIQGANAGRDLDGTFHADPIGVKHKFVLIEM